MSVAKRAKKDAANEPVPPNDDEGMHERSTRTNQALKWAKNGISDAKLYIYAKTGQIQESDDPAEVLEAFQKLDTYKEQIQALLSNAENWTKTMFETWQHQIKFIEALNECQTVIQTFDRKTDCMEAHDEQPVPLAPRQQLLPAHRQQHHDHEHDLEEYKHSPQPPPPPVIHISNNSQFASIMKGIADELHIDQQASEHRYGKASKLLVVPLRNILENEVMHAVEMKKKYAACKRQYDNCGTTITNAREKIKELQNPNKAAAGAGAGVGRMLSSKFSKLLQGTTAASKEELEDRLEFARQEMPQYIKVYEQAKQQLLEAINVIEDKLNIEVVYYVQQFYTFVQEWKRDSGNDKISEEYKRHSSHEQSDNHNGSPELHNEREEVQIQQMVQEEEVEEEHANNDHHHLISELQMDAMMQINGNNENDKDGTHENANENENMDEIKLDSPNPASDEVDIVTLNQNKSVVVEEDDQDDGSNDEEDLEQAKQQVNIEEVEISETHDVDT